MPRPQADTPAAVAFTDGDTVARFGIEVRVCGTSRRLSSTKVVRRGAPVA